MGNAQKNVKDLLNAGLEYHNAGDLAQAEHHYQQVLALDPNQSDAIHFMGVLATGAGELDKARQYLERAIELSPGNAACYNNMGNVYQNQGDYEGSIPYYEKTLELNPSHYMAHNNLGAAHIRLGNYARALEFCKKAVALESHYPAGWNNLGDCCANLGELDRAMAYYDKALEQDPEMVDAHWNRALCLLSRGDLEQGFDAYRWRWKRPKTPRRDIDADLKWNGSNFCGRNIFVYEEQGLGDTLQFIRYLPLLKNAGGRVIFEASPGLVRLFSGMECIDKLWVRRGRGSTRDIDRFDAHCPILDLPYHFRTTMETIPAQVPYLYADKAMAAAWARRLGHTSDFRIGIVWAGNPNHRNNMNRSCPLSMFKALADIPGISLYSLQKDKYPEWTDVDLEELGCRDLGDEVFDFADTAAVVENLDLVISVDTSVVHLAGAMGKETWIMLPFNADWRWGRRGEDSPWYPSARLFRQPGLGDWNPVFEKMRAELKKRTGKTFPEK